MSRHRAGTAVIAKGRKSIDEILDAATALLAEEGYANLSTRKVAARAGMRPGNLQYYFPAKRDMVHALLERYLDRSLERLADRIEGAQQTPEVRLRKVIDGVLAAQASAVDGTLFRGVWALPAHHGDVATAMTEFYSRFRALLASTLRSVSPGLRRGDSQRLATAIAAMLEGLSIFRQPGAPRPTLQSSYVCEMVLHLVHGFEQPA